MCTSYTALFPSTFSLFDRFLQRWVVAVPELTRLGKITSNQTSGASKSDTSCADCVTAANDTASKDPTADDADNEDPDAEFVEQEGCPEDTDFNKWSHHTSVNTCDDTVLQNSLSDSGSVSFVFGLEVRQFLFRVSCVVSG